MKHFEEDIQQCLTVLHSGGLILYPTDTVWGIGCDATNEAAVKKIYSLKKRGDAKSLIVLVATEGEVLKHVAALHPDVFHFLAVQTRPTTVIFDGAIGFAPNLVAADGSIAIRIAQDEFCRHLIKRFRKPVVSTSANISGSPTPAQFGAIEEEIKNGVDHIVRWRQDDTTQAQPSRIVSWKNGQITVLRD